MEFLRKKSWSPYAVGALIGLLIIFIFYALNKPFGVSGAYSQTAVMIQKVFAPDYVKNNEYIRDTMPAAAEGTGIDWGWMFVLGIFIGAFISSQMSGGFKTEVVPELWKSRFGPGIGKRLISAFLGGILLLFGARLAEGCTAWHGLNGSLQLALSGWIFFMVIFITGIVTARIMYGGAR
jgi:uncharacterized membrane protein YedE/YeeE